MDDNLLYIKLYYMNELLLLALIVIYFNCIINIIIILIIDFQIGIDNYSTVNTCHSRPSQTRSDYGKLFVVLVIIGSVCVLIIASGIIYICWQRRLPKLKNMVGLWDGVCLKNTCSVAVAAGGGGAQTNWKYGRSGPSSLILFFFSSSERLVNGYFCKDKTELSFIWRYCACFHIN